MVFQQNFIETHRESLKLKIQIMRRLKENIIRISNVILFIMLKLFVFCEAYNMYFDL